MAVHVPGSYAATTKAWTGETTFNRRLSVNGAEGELWVFIARVCGSSNQEITPPVLSPVWTLKGSLPGVGATPSRVFIWARIAKGIEELDHTSSVASGSGWVTALVRVANWSADLNDVNVALAESSQPPSITPSWTGETAWITGITGRTQHWTIDGQGPEGYAIDTRSIEITTQSGTEVNINGGGICVQHRTAETGGQHQPGEWLLDVASPATLSEILPVSFTIAVKGDGFLYPDRANTAPELLATTSSRRETQVTDHAVTIPSHASASDGDLLLIWIRTGGTDRYLSAVPSPWKVLGRRNNGGG